MIPRLKITADDGDGQWRLFADDVEIARHRSLQFIRQAFHEGNAEIDRICREQADIRLAVWGFGQTACSKIGVLS